MPPSTNRRAHCLALLEQLSEYLDGELPPAERRTFEKHLNDCVCCTSLASHMRRAIALCRAVEGPRLTAAQRRKARARIAALLSAEAPR
jgi:anti-sigma factor RsiW